MGVVVDRLPKGQNLFKGRSHCDSCKHILGVFDLIPVLSYLLLHGKCRYCHKKIPISVFVIESLSGILFVLIFLSAFTNWIAYALLCAESLTLLAIAFIDIQEGIISDILLGILGMLGILGLLVEPSQILSHLLTAIITFTFFLVIFLLTRGRGIGFGDVKYAFFIGLLLSWQGVLVALYTAFLTGAVISIILVIAGKKKLRGATIPFGPFLSLGVIVSLLFNRQIMGIILPLLKL